MYLYIMYPLFLRKKKATGKKLVNTENILEEFGDYCEQALGRGKMSKYWLDKTWEEKGRWKDSVLWMGEFQVSTMFETWITTENVECG